MKFKRQKKVNRILNFFQTNFGHRAPFQVLIDGTFCQACLSMKINIRDQLPKYLGEAKLLTTKCCIEEAEKLGPQVSGALHILKQFPVHKCPHMASSIPAIKCFRDMLGKNNENRYFVASQDEGMRDRARRVAGTPVLYLHHCAPTLEKPSPISAKAALQSTNERMESGSKSAGLQSLKSEVLGEDEEQRVRKRKKQSGPNPLSCLKAKRKKESRRDNNNDSQNKHNKDKNEKEEEESEPKRRKRFRKRKNATNKRMSSTERNSVIETQ